MICVRTLGQCSIQIDTITVGPDAEIVFAALLLLTVDRGRRVGRNELLALLWPQTSPSRAAHCLRQTIYRVRQLGAPLQSDRTHLAFASNAIDSDVDGLLRANRSDDVEKLADRIHGPFLPGYAPGFSEPLRDWVEHLRDRVSAGARRVLVAAIGARKSQGEWSDVERLAHRCLAIDPLNEDATLALAEAAALHGGRVEAVGILDRYLREMGPTARELRLPAIALRRRISEPDLEFPLAAPLAVPFVGRSAEMATLTAALRSARSGGGSVHLIHGEPGIGKTRLLTEFTRAASLEGARLAQTVCQSSDSRRPLSAFVDLLPKLMMMPGALGCSPQAHKYLRRLIDHHSHSEPPTPDTSEASLLYENVRRSLFDLLDAVSSEGVLLLAIDDVQWLDTASWEIATEAGAWVQTRRVILLLASRDRQPRHIPPLHTVPESVQPLHLGPIDRSAAERLFDTTVCRSGCTSAHFRTWCVGMSGGNPFYLTELALRGLSGRGTFEVPPTLSALMAQRVARLRPMSCRVLQACAVLGKNATLERIEAMLGQKRVALLDAFDELGEHALIGWDDSQIISRHDLLSQAAIARLSTISRRLLHRHAAIVLENATSEEINPTLAWCAAEHWYLAGTPEHGATPVCKCARQAIELGRPNDAVDLLEHVTDLPLPPRARLEVSTELLYAYRAADRWHDAMRQFAALRSLRNECSGEGAIHDETELIGFEATWFGGCDLRPTITGLVECCKSARATPEHRIAAARLCLILAANLRDAATARQVFELVEPDLQRGQDDSAVGFECRLIFETEFGNHRVAAKIIDQLIQVSQGSSPRQRATSLILASFGCELIGMTERIADLAKQAYQIAAEYSCGTAASSAARKLAWAYLEAGNFEQAQHWYNVAKSWVKKGQFSSFKADLFGIEAEILIGQHDYAGAEEALRQSITAWNETIHPTWKLAVLSARCAIWLATGERRQCEAAVEDYRELVMPAYRCGGNETHAARYFRLLAFLGRREEARQELGRYLNLRTKSPGNYGAALRALLDDLASTDDCEASTNGHPLSGVSQECQQPLAC